MHGKGCVMNIIKITVADHELEISSTPAFDSKVKELSDKVTANTIALKNKAGHSASALKNNIIVLSAAALINTASALNNAGIKIIEDSGIVDEIECNNNNQ